MSEKKQLIVIAGPEASGKHTFADVFGNAFVQGLSEDNLYKGIISGQSFYCCCSFSSSDDIKMIQLAKEKGYRVTIYFLFVPKALCLVRARLRSLTSKIPYSQTEIISSYDASIKVLLALQKDIDILFLVKNLKDFEFVTAFAPSSISTKTYQATIAKILNSIILL